MRNRKKGNGQALVELALVLPIFILVIMGIVDFARVFHVQSTLNYQCTQAARVGTKRLFQLIARSAFTSTTHETREHVEAAFWAGLSPLMPRSQVQGPTMEGVGTTDQTVAISARCNVEIWTPLMGNILGNPFVVAAVAREQKE